MSLTVYGSLQDFIREAVQSYDSSIDVSSGSRFDTEVTKRIMDRLGPDPTDTPVEQIIIQRLNDNSPEIATEIGTGVRDTMIEPLSLILEPIRLLSRTRLLRQGWDKSSLLSEEEADVLANNVFYSRDDGEYASGSLRMYFASPRNITVTPINTARAGALNFLPSRIQQISMTQMSTQTSGARFYMDIDLTAEKAGDEYNVVAGSITSITGVPGLIGVEQLYDMEVGRARHDNAALKEATEESIVVRNLTTYRSIRTVLPDTYHFPSIGRIEIIGRGDPSMERDIVRRPAGFGLPNISGLPGGVSGEVDPSVMVPSGISIGGFSDVWIAPSTTGSDIEESLDILNIVDEGTIVYHSNTGNVSTGFADLLIDRRAFFTEDDGANLPVRVGDFLIVEGLFAESNNQHEEFEITKVIADGDPLYPDLANIAVQVGEDILPVLSPSLVNVSYEIRRREDGKVQISLDSLVAQDGEDTLFDTHGNPYMPVPGRTLASEGEVAVRNIGSGNVSLPIFYVETVELLDPRTAQPTGVYIPEADPVAYFVHRRISSTQYWVRVLYRLPTAFATLFNDGGLLGGAPTSTFHTFDAQETLKPAYLSSGPAGGGGIGADPLTDIIDAGIDYMTAYSAAEGSRAPRKGDYLVAYDGVNYYGSFIEATNVSGATVYQTVDKKFPVGPALSVIITQGTKMVQMSGDEPTDQIGQDDSGLYYFEFIATASTANSIDIDDNSSLATPAGTIMSQGWRVVPRKESESFSTMEEPVLQITEVVNDETDMTEEATNVRLTYLTTPVVAQAQALFDDEDESAPSEYSLARRMPPARIHFALHYRGGAVSGLPAAAEAKTALVNGIRETTTGLNATQISNIVEGLGASEVVYPFRIHVEYSGKRRGGKDGFGRILSFMSFQGTVVPDTFVESIVNTFRMAHFIDGNIEAIKDA